jgi:hypothetical protein
LRLHRNRILGAVRSNLDSAWPVVEGVWSHASAVYRTRVGASATKPFELVVLDEVRKDRPGGEHLLLKHLLHKNPNVAAYCLLGLEQMGSPKIKELPVEILTRKELILIYTGCFVRSETLGDFAKQISNFPLVIST